MDLILWILALVIPLLAQWNISATYSSHKRVANGKSKCGQEVAREILDANGLNNVHVVEVNGNLTDHYDPKQKVVRLSTEIFHGESVAAMAVAAHECGHAIQDKEDYSWLRIRTAMCPVVNFITYSAYVLILISFLLQLFNLLYLSFAIVFAGLLFQLVTLPVEFNASERAIQQLDNLGLTTTDSRTGVKKVLTAAAYTYVAAVLTSLLEILRILIRIDNNRD